MSKYFKVDSRAVIRNLDHVVTRSNVALLALVFITNEYNLEYFKDLGQEDIGRNLDTLFEELRAIHELLNEENEDLREYKLKLEKELV